MRKVSRTSRWPWALSVAAGAGAVYLLYRYFRLPLPHLEASVAERLPIAKNLDTIPDQVGNYDIDGVSFDTEGTVVGSDAHKDASVH